MLCLATPKTCGQEGQPCCYNLDPASEEPGLGGFRGSQCDRGAQGLRRGVSKQPPSHSNPTHPALVFGPLPTHPPPQTHTPPPRRGPLPGGAHLHRRGRHSLLQLRPVRAAGGQPRRSEGHQGHGHLQEADQGGGAEGVGQACQARVGAQPGPSASAVRMALRPAPPAPPHACVSSPVQPPTPTPPARAGRLRQDVAPLRQRRRQARLHRRRPAVRVRLLLRLPRRHPPRRAALPAAAGGVRQDQRPVLPRQQGRRRAGALDPRQDHARALLR
jgi:hypothetical protein